jgi:hypothetical protein
MYGLIIAKTCHFCIFCRLLVRSDEKLISDLFFSVIYYGFFVLPAKILFYRSRCILAVRGAQ